MINEKWKCFFNSFRGKILLIFFIFSLASSVMLGSFCYTGVYNQMLSSTVDYSGALANQISRNTSMILEETSRILMIGNSSSVSGFLYDEGNRHETTMELIVMMKLYRESAVFSEDIQNFYILGNDGVCFNEKRGIYQIERHEKSQYIYDMILNHENELLVLSSREMGWEEEDCFVIGQKIRQTWTNKTIGIIAIEMKAHAVQSVYMDEVLGETGYFSLYDKDGREMFSEGEQRNRRNKLAGRGLCK